MAMRLQEVHPSVVHFPIALLPVALGADALGRLTRSRSLLQVGKWGMALTAGTAALAGFTGLVAQEEVEAKGPANDLLVTHRSLNVGFLGLATTMAVWRFQCPRPGLRYLAVGLAGLATVTYSAYLGGKMVYEHGVGVKAAGGIREGHAPELFPGRAGEWSRHAVAEAKEAVRHAAGDVAQGRVAPAFGREAGAA